MKHLERVTIYTLLLCVSNVLLYFVFTKENKKNDATENVTQTQIEENSSPKNLFGIESDDKKLLEKLIKDNKDVPYHALATLVYVRQKRVAPPNFLGGRTFQNREKLLPKIKNEKYQEWDVHPKKEGKNRGAERLVTSANQAYYTKDHYQSFIQIKE
ncbi:MAG TPA: ribonuclease domain-containing protein [Saprospiraceae bacterium]|nr:ribonuclease domain-containing protein [Saprospiraceae bacterium]